MIQVGFDISQEILTPSGNIQLSDLKIGDSVIGLLSSDQELEINVANIERVYSQRNIKIVFNDDTCLICSYFASVFSETAHTFVSAHKVRIGDIVKTYFDKNMTVKSLKLSSINDYINPLFKQKASFFINNILCHSLKEPSEYAIFAKDKNNLPATTINQLSKIIYPEHKYNHDLGFQWKYENSKLWRKATGLTPSSFDTKSGLTFGDGNNLEIQINLNKDIIENKRLLINVIGSSVDIQGKNFEKYEVNNNCILILNLFESNLNFLNIKLNSNKTCILSNCVLISQSEYQNIQTYYQGNLAQKE